jgi:hypothetical protein
MLDRRHRGGNVSRKITHPGAVALAAEIVEDRADQMSSGERAIALALIAIAEELEELNAQLKRDAKARPWQLP